MITNFTKKVGLATAILIVTSSAANAAVFNANASFRTIADISITEVAALSFGTAVTGKAGTDCTLIAAVGAGLLVATTNATVESTSSGCSSADAVVGDYLLAGANDVTITILMETATDTDFTFAPAGDYGDDTNETTYFADAPFNVVTSASGAGVISVGGTLNILNELVASTSYAVAYDISVVY
ncbi:MAG: acetyl-CoA acetyltransferase [Paraglaciecola sp.]|jgi:acetyl-CoA acetyltransferase